MSFKAIQVVLTGSNTGLRGVLQTSATEIDKFQKRVKASNDSLFNSRNVMRGAAAGGLALAAALFTGGKAAAGLETNMRNVNSLLGLSEPAFDALTKQVVNLSTKLPQSAEILSSGLYDIASSGFNGADGLKVLNAAAVAASAGLSTTATAAQVITSVINAYGKSANDAADISDTLFQGVNLGVITFDGLASTLGDVIGAAAAAKIPIDQVTAAIATMTLAGVSAGETGTSLNRVIQSIVQPSDNMAVALKQVGFESGAAALQADGLKGVMDRLRETTGGNITAMLELFPDIRAARGALALMANDGQNYNRVSAGIVDVTARHGKAQKVLEEQLKSTSAQFKIFENKIIAVGITVGQHVLPLVQAAMRGAISLGHAIGQGLQQASGFFQAAEDIGKDLISIIKTLAQVAGPTVKLLGALGGQALLTTLTAAARVLDAILGTLARHPAAVVALAGVITASLIPALARLIATLSVGAFTKFFTGVGMGIGILNKAKVGIQGLGAAMSVGNVATAGLTVAALALAGGMEALANDTAKAKKQIDEMTQGVNITDFATTQKTIDQLRQVAEEALKAKNQASGLFGRLHAGEQLINPFEANGIDEAASKGKAAAEAYRQLSQQLSNTKENALAAARAAGAVVDENDPKKVEQATQAFADLAQKQGIDLSKSGAQGAAAQKQLVKVFQDTAGASGATAARIKADGQVDIDALAAAQKAADDFAKSVSDAFSKATDVLSGFQPTVVTAQDLADAMRAVKDANSEAAQATQEYHRELSKTGHGRDEAAAASKVADARAKAAKAQQDYNKLLEQSKPAAQQLQAQYREQVRSASQFADNLLTAAKKGLDPNELKKLLEAGPTAAAPALQALVADNSGKLIQMVNDSEKALSAINERVTAMARLTQQAIDAPTDQKAKDLAKAIQIQTQTLLAGPGGQTAGAVAKAVGLRPEEVKRVADEFGITLSQGVIDGIGKNQPKLLQDAVQFGVAVAQAVQRGATQNPINLVLGGFIGGANAAEGPGVSLTRPNPTPGLPRSGPRPMLPQTPAAPGPAPRPSAQPSSIVNQYNTNVGTVVAKDYNDFQAQMDRKRRLGNLVGRRAI